MIVKTTWHSPEQTQAFAQRWALRMQQQPALANALVTLDGELGTGKTTLVRYLLQALGVQGRIKSPTYALVESYTLGEDVLPTNNATQTTSPVGAGLARDGHASNDALGTPSRARPAPTNTPNKPTLLSIWHFDFYRLDDPKECEEAGLCELFASPGLKLVEWPEKAGSHLPQADVAVQLELRADESRSVTLRAYTPRGVAVLEEMLTKS